MKKMLLLFSVAMAVSAGVTHAQNFVYENFNATVGGALPTNWTSNPANQWKTGAPDDIAAFYRLGESGNAASHMMAVSINGNSASANDAVLSTPAINLPGSATAAKLVFDKCYFGVSLQADPSKKETFTLVVSTNGGTTWSDLAIINANSASGWSDTAINVGTYAGQSNLKFGFKYNNTGTALVGASLDNIRVYVQGANDIAITTAAPVAGTPAGYKVVGGTVSVTGTVYNYGSATLNNYTVKYQQGANPAVAYNVTGANIASLEGGSFTHNVPFTIPSVGTFPLKVWVEQTGDTYHGDDTAAAQAVGVAFMPAKRLVFEEGTGTWCGWCPRGAVFMEEFAEETPNMAAQIAVHNSDPMEVSAYDNYMVTYNGGGFPNLVTDRAILSDPSDVSAVYNEMKDNFGFAELTMGAPTVSGTTVTIPVTVKAATAISNPKLSLVVTESNVVGSGSGWPQTNYYEGGGNGAMGGWESQPESVTNVRYHFVARAISPSPAGEASGLPATLTANTTYTATVTATLNPAWKVADLQYIVMLNDGNSTNVLNSVFSPLPVLKPGLITPTSISNVEAGIEKAQLYPNPTADKAYLQVELKEATAATMTITDATGRSVTAPKTSALHAGNNVLEVPTAGLSNGIYLVNLETGKGRISMKLNVVK
jgi:thiol-disulfide isomerase/thioredoxin